MHPYIKPLSKELKESADPQRAVGAKAYMKNQFDYFGMPMAERRAIFKHHVKQHAVSNEKELEIIVKELWSLPEREFQYCGMELIAHYKKTWSPLIIKLIEFCITTKSWWDTVDFIATNCCGNYFQLYPEKIGATTHEWNYSSNMWLQRTSLLFQNKYKNKTDSGLLSTYILHLSSSKEFFIRKAIGWVLREYAKTNPEWVKDFVGNHMLSSLSKREAMKHLG
jgi:3-methyladenine DNA glycosylase AlkD